MDTPAQEKKPKLSMPLAIIIAGALIALSIVVTNMNPVTPPTVGAEAVGDVSVRAIGPGDHVYGSRDAEVLLVEYSDFQCPFCAQIHSSLKRIVDESNGTVAWVYRHFPLTSIHPEALPAAIASECIAKLGGENSFWAFAAAALSSQGDLSDGFYLAMASQAGIPAGEFNACYTGDEFGSRIEDDFAEAVTAGGQGTPYVVVQKGGRGAPFAGALPYAQIKAIVDVIASE